MATNRVQFQVGLSMAEFLTRYGTERLCQQALEAARWPSGFVCPRCHGARVRSTFFRGDLPYWQCGVCDRQCSLISGTIFEATKLPLTRWFLAMQLMTQAKNTVSALELMRQLGVSYRTAWLVKHKLMEVMRRCEENRELSGTVQLDDAYLGGERQGGIIGRGSENKVPLVIAVEVSESGKAQAACMLQIPHTAEAVSKFAKRHLARSTLGVSDGLRCFLPLGNLIQGHTRFVTGGGRKSVKLPQLSAINTFLGNLKTAFAGTYHAFDFVKYTNRYLGDVQYRFNRRFDMRGMLQRLLHDAATCLAVTQHRLRDAEVAA